MLEAPRRAAPDLHEPTPAAAPPCLDLYRFRVLSNSDRAHVFLFVLPTCLAGTHLDQAGARFGLALAPGFLCLLRLSRPGGFRDSNRVDLSRLDHCHFAFF